MQIVNRIKKNPMIITFVIVFLVIFTLNCLTPWVADDYAYATSHSILDIFSNEYIQYMNWGGRSVAHILARFFLMIPKIIFNLMNSLCFLVLTIAIYLHAIGRKEWNHPYIFLCIVCLIILFVPSFGQTILWLTGSCNYLWMSTFIFVFLLPFRLNLDAKNPSLHMISLCILGILAGWSNENSGGGVILMMLLMIGYRLIKHYPIKHYVIAMLFSCIGFILMILAPGNYVRADELVVDMQVYDYVHKLLNLMDVYFSASEGLLVVLIGIICGVVLTFALKIKSSSIVSALMNTVVGIAVVFAMVLTPVTIYFDRSMFGASLWLIVALASLWIPLVNERSTKVVTIAFATTLSCIACVQLAYGSVDIAYLFYQNSSRMNYLQTQLQSGNTHPVISEYDSEFFTRFNPMLGLVDIEKSTSSNINREFCAVVGCEYVTTTQANLFNEIYKTGNSELMNIQDITTYVNTLMAQNATFMITTNQLSSTNREMLVNLGLFSDVLQESDSYFVAFVDHGSIIYTASDDSAIDYYGRLDEKDIYISSYPDGVDSNIVIDEQEYSLDNDGITIVVFDRTSYRVSDAVTFDSGLCYRYMTEVK